MIGRKKIQYVIRHKTTFINVGFFPAKDMQTPSPLRINCSHFHETCGQCWIEWKINYHIFIFWVMWLYLQFRSDTHEFSSVSPTKKKVIQKFSNLQKRCAMSWNEWKIKFPIFIFWVMVDLVLKIHWKIYQFWIQKRP